MCFSAPVSFAAGGTLIAAGLYTRAKGEIPKQYRMLTHMITLFGIHQVAEGVVWLGLRGHAPEYLKDAAAYLYMIIANTLWPVYVPLAIVCFEKAHLYRAALAAVFVTGLGVSALLTAAMLNSPLTAEIACCRFGYGHIDYDFFAPFLFAELPYIYLFTVVAPFFLTSRNAIRFMVGPAFLICFPVAKFLSDMRTFPSVWCFLAALISLIIIWAVSKQIRTDRKTDNEDGRIEDGAPVN